MRKGLVPATTQALDRHLGGGWGEPVPISDVIFYKYERDKTADLWTFEKTIWSV